MRWGGGILTFFSFSTMYVLDVPSSLFLQNPRREERTSLRSPALIGLRIRILRGGEK